MESMVAIAMLLLLLGILILLGLLLYTVLFHLRWMVPFVPTPMPIVRTMVGAAHLKPGDTVMDLGAGDARLLLIAKRAEPGIRAVGYEGAFFVWLLGKFKIFLSRKKGIAWHRKNFLAEDLSEADVIFAYLSISMMQRLCEKFKTELRPGTRIISHAFRMKELEPVSKHAVPMTFGGMTNVYVYEWRERQT
jgi:precorrin-6B methylase 2